MTNPFTRAWDRIALSKEDRARLDVAISSLRVEVEARSGGEMLPWVEAANGHLQDAEARSVAGQVDEGWIAAKAARRELTMSWQREEVEFEASRLRQEAKDKLSGWRSWTLTESDALRSLPAGLEEARRIVQSAQAVVDEHSDNVYQRLRLLAKGVARSSYLLLGVLTGLWALVAVGIPEALANDGILSDPMLLISVMVVGAVGAVVSSVTTYVADRGQARVPDARARLSPPSHQRREFLASRPSSIPSRPRHTVCTTSGCSTGSSSIGTSPTQRRSSNL